jgi:hypothetical protein
MEEMRTWRGYMRQRRVGVEGGLGFIDVDWRGWRRVRVQMVDVGSSGARAD